MQERLLRETINENQIYTSSNALAITQNPVTTDEKDAESDSKSETSDSCVLGSLEGESVSMLSGFTDQEIEQHFNQHSAISSEFTGFSSEIDTLSDSMDSTQLNQLMSEANNSSDNLNGNDTSSETAEISQFSNLNSNNQSEETSSISTNSLPNPRLLASSDSQLERDGTSRFFSVSTMPNVPEQTDVKDSSTSSVAEFRHETTEEEMNSLD